jgi:hypothetical protein
LEVARQILEDTPASVDDQLRVARVPAKLRRFDEAIFAYKLLPPDAAPVELARVQHWRVLATSLSRINDA